MKTTKQRRPRSQRSRRGTTAVEFALTFPMLMALTFLCFDMARLSMMRNLANNAAYETARFSMMEGADQARAQEVAEDILARLGTQCATIEVNGGAPLSDPGNSIDVSITIPVAENALILDQVFNVLGFTKKWDSEVIIWEISLRKERYEGFFDVDEV